MEQMKHSRIFHYALCNCCLVVSFHWPPGEQQLLALLTQTWKSLPMNFHTSLALGPNQSYHWIRIPTKRTFEHSKFGGVLALDATVWWSGVEGALWSVSSESPNSLLKYPFGSDPSCAEFITAKWLVSCRKPWRSRRFHCVGDAAFINDDILTWILLGILLHSIDCIHCLCPLAFDCDGVAF